MIWKDIKGYEGLYKISEYGDIKAVETKSLRKLNQGLTEINFKERILKPTKVTNKNRYKSISLCRKDNKNNKSSKMIHRLVYEAFIGDINEDRVIDHIDNDRNNNHYTNLQMITQKENARKYFSRQSTLNLEKNTKICNRCNVEKNTSEFYKKCVNIYSDDIWRGHCKKCHNKK